MYKTAIVTLSDKAFQGIREDLSGKVIEELLLTSPSFEFEDYVLIPDEQEEIEKTLIRLCDENQVALILTTGGTGFSLRDVTPEATLNVVHRRTPGISEAMRNFSMKITPRAMLSRAESGLRDKTLIVNLPGSPKAVREILEYLLPQLEHGMDILYDKSKECATPIK